MAWLKNNALRLLAIMALIGVGLWLNRTQQFLTFLPNALPAGHHYASQDGVSPLITSTTAQPPEYALHILFIGNSFTFFHDIPRQLADIASADPGNPTQFIIQSVTRGAIGLKELWDSGTAAQMIQDGPSPGAH